MRTVPGRATTGTTYSAKPRELTDMNEPSTLRLNLLRACYLLMFVGLALVVWPQILFGAAELPLMTGAANALLGALGLLCGLGIRARPHVTPARFRGGVEGDLVRFCRPATVASGAICDGGGRHSLCLSVGCTVPLRHSLAVCGALRLLARRSDGSSRSKLRG